MRKNHICILDSTGKTTKAEVRDTNNIKKSLGKFKLFKEAWVFAGELKKEYKKKGVNVKLARVKMTAKEFIKTSPMEPEPEEIEKTKIKNKKIKCPKPGSSMDVETFIKWLSQQIQISSTKLEIIKKLLFNSATFRKAPMSLVQSVLAGVEEEEYLPRARNAVFIRKYVQ